jgi:hypothetical protein
MVTEASGIFQRATNLPSLRFNGSSGHGTLKRWRYQKLQNTQNSQADKQLENGKCSENFNRVHPFAL